MRVLISGASGLIGSRLARRLREGAHEVCTLVRRPVRMPSEIRWDPAGGSLPPRDIEGFDAVVHLAGESLASGRWTEARMARIRDSRVGGTSLLARSLARCERRPAALVSASAIGYYGDRGDEILEEGSGAGEGFLARTCVEWEAAATPAREKGIRVVHPRLGVVLAQHGGALPRMLLPFRLGAGGRVGSGRQWLSWISIEDALRVFEAAVLREDLWGAVNAVAPVPVTNAEFARTVGLVLHRPAFLPAPAFALRAALGRMADELLLASTRVVPRTLERLGFEFAHRSLEEALRSVLGRAA